MGAALGLDVLSTFYVDQQPFLVGRVTVAPQGGLQGLAMADLSARTASSLSAVRQKAASSNTRLGAEPASPAGMRPTCSDPMRNSYAYYDAIKGDLVPSLDILSGARLLMVNIPHTRRKPTQSIGGQKVRVIVQYLRSGDPELGPRSLGRWNDTFRS